MSFKTLGQPFKDYVKPSRAIDTVFLHCDASSNPDITVMDIHQWHLDLGWSGCGYHVYIDNDGKSWHGRDLSATGSHASGYNTGSIGISCNGLDISDFSEAQFAEVRRICAQIRDAHGGKIRFRGHNEIANKLCPVYNHREVLGLDANGYMTGTAAPGEPPKSRIPMVDIMVAAAQIGLHDHHPHVIVLRALLVRYGASKDALFPIRDKEYLMKFDDIVNDATRGFQREQGLVDDGIVGRSTWERLLDVGDD